MKLEMQFMQFKTDVYPTELRPSGRSFKKMLK